MLTQLIPYLVTPEYRSVREYTHFKEEQMRYMSMYRNRAMLTIGHESAGVRLLRYILQFVDYNYMDSREDNYKRYTDHLRIIRRDINSIFDRIRLGESYHDLFFASNTNEYLLPVEDVNTIINLPLDTDDWNIWKRVRPVRIWSHDSNELTMNILNDQVTFSEDVPIYAVVIIDIIALIMKYYIWNKYAKNNEPADVVNEIPQQLFMHKYVCCDMYQDLLDVWLLRNMIRVMQCSSIDEVFSKFDSNTLQGNSIYGRVGTSSRRGYGDLYRVCTVKYITPAIICSTPLLASGSILDRLVELDTHLTLPVRSESEYIRWLRDRDLLRFITALFQRRPDNGTTRTVMKTLRLSVGRMLNHRPWSKCGNLKLRQKVKDDMESYAEEIAL